MPRLRITKVEKTCVDTLVEAYEKYSPQVSLFKEQLLMALTSAERLNQHVHSIGSRLKDPAHLRDKLIRKMLGKTDQSPFDVSTDNLLTKINDLVGVRILHLYTRQIPHIDKALREIFEENQYQLMEGPFARTWDDESRTFFRELGIETQESPSMYTSVHYVIGSASRTRVTAEIQVRTLMEEVWGEVDHALNYPYKTNSLACAEQLKVLARVTSSATRLVDSIFLTMEHHPRDAILLTEGDLSATGPNSDTPTRSVRKRHRVVSVRRKRRRRLGKPGAHRS